MNSTIIYSYSIFDMMNKIEIENLDLLIKTQYAHICINPFNLNQFLNIPWQEKLFYRLRSKELYDKKGFFNNGKTACWTNMSLPSGYIKIATQIPTSSDGNIWSDPFSFGEPDSVIKISKMMKLKAFW